MKVGWLCEAGRSSERCETVIQRMEKKNKNVYSAADVTEMQGLVKAGLM